MSTPGIDQLTVTTDHAVPLPEQRRRRRRDPFMRWPAVPTVFSTLLGAGALTGLLLATGAVGSTALSIVAAVATAVQAGALVALHVLPTGYSPVRDAVSDYGVGRYRIGFWVQVLAGGVASMALAIALAQSSPAKPILAVAMLLLCAAARFLLPAFPTDQRRGRFQTVKGTTHMVLAVTVFAAIAVAASSLGSTLGNEPAWHGVNGLVDGWLPWVITGTAIATALAIRAPRLKRIFGLIERSFYLSSIAWFLIVSIELARI